MKIPKTRTFEEETNLEDVIFLLFIMDLALRKRSWHNAWELLHRTRHDGGSLRRFR